MGVQLREIIPDGTQWGTLGEYLPDWVDLTFGQDLVTHSSLKFDYANKGSHRNKLKTGTFVVAEVDGNIEWYDSIFYLEELTGESSMDDTGMTTFNGYSLRKKLEGIRWMPAIGSTYIDSTGFRYINMTPPNIINAGIVNYMSRAKNRYKDKTMWLSSVVYSPGWNVKLDEIVVPTTSVADLVTKYQDMGLATVRFLGFNLIISPYDWAVDHPARDKTNSVELRAGFNLMRGTFSESSEDVVTSLLVRGAEDPFRSSDANNLQTNVVQWVTASQSEIDRYGYREHILDVPEASNPATLKVIGQNYLNRRKTPRYSATYEMVQDLYDPATGKEIPTPKVLKDFQCGDSILVLSERGPTTEKVYAITLSYESPQRPGTIGLTLNDYFVSWEVKFNQRLKRLGA